MQTVLQKLTDRSFLAMIATAIMSWYGVYISFSDHSIPPAQRVNVLMAAIGSTALVVGIFTHSEKIKDATIHSANTDLEISKIRSTAILSTQATSSAQSAIEYAVIPTTTQSTDAPDEPNNPVIDNTPNQPTVVIGNEAN